MKNFFRQLRRVKFKEIFSIAVHKKIIILRKEVDNFIKNGIIGIWAGSICLRLSEFSATTQRKVEVGEPF